MILLLIMENTRYIINRIDGELFKDVERYFYYGEKPLEAPENDENRPPKPVLVMTKRTKTEDLYNVPLYRCKSYLHLVESTPELSIEIENDPKFREFEKYDHDKFFLTYKIIENIIFQSFQTKSLI